MTEGTPLLDITGAVATLTLRRPSQRNSLTDDDLNTLLAHFETINRNAAVHVVVLRADTTAQSKPCSALATTWEALTTTPWPRCSLKKSPKL